MAKESYQPTCFEEFAITKSERDLFICCKIAYENLLKIYRAL
jgi:hypothetical protein